MKFVAVCHPDDEERFRGELEASLRDAAEKAMAWQGSPWRGGVVLPSYEFVTRDDCPRGNAYLVDENYAREVLGAEAPPWADGEEITDGPV